MKIGLHVPQWGNLAGREALLAVGRAAEGSGLASIWVSDHLVYPLEASSHYPYTDDGTFPLYDSPFLEMFAALALLAGSTEQIELGTSVMVLPMRNTVVTAKQLSTLAVLAPGRLVIGVGAGWLREELELLGNSYEHRGRILDEQIEALRGLFRTPSFSYKGEHVEFPELVMEPRPEQLPPIWIGGNSAAAVSRAGRLGDAWHPVSLGTPEDLVQDYARVRAIAAESKRESGVELTVRIGAEVAPSYTNRLRRELDGLQRVGCAHVLVDPEYPALRDAVDFCERLGELANEFKA